MAENYSSVIESLSTDELKDIYFNRFLDYNEEFVISCYNELTQKRGITPKQIDTEIENKSTCNLHDVVRNLRVNGRTKNDIIRYMKHFRINDYDDVLNSVKEEEKEEKKNKYNEEIIGGLGLCGIVFIVYLLGYEITFFNCIPGSAVLLVIGAVTTIVGLVKRLMAN